MSERGWYLSHVDAGATSAGPEIPKPPAHYFVAADWTLCDQKVTRTARWLVEQHVGKIPLCEDCKGRIVGKT